MALLLPSAMSAQATQYTLQMDRNSQISITPKSNTKKIPSNFKVSSRDSISAEIRRDS
ncbi:hypothetical protein DPMN_014043 [Dreissena polymorpha]|uniref:Uncharacterized protein n=1 Tax=Dreissena polymorpha TaxID=45954 RepID=A0A9D4N8W3_DREPO|nr:hypothetical protein DPMN_014043 [Dreissena polymorpha]